MGDKLWHRFGRAFMNIYVSLIDMSERRITMISEWLLFASKSPLVHPAQQPIFYIIIVVFEGLDAFVHVRVGLCVRAQVIYLISFM